MAFALRNDAASAAGQRLQAVRVRRLEAEVALARVNEGVTDLKRQGGRLVDDTWLTSQTTLYQTEIDRAADEEAPLVEEMQRIGLSAQDGTFVTRTQIFVEELRDKHPASDRTSYGSPAHQRVVRWPLADVPVVPVPALLEGESFAAALERLRARVRTLAADLHQIEASPLPSTLAKDLARDQIAGLAAEGRPHVRPLIELGQPVAFPRDVLSGRNSAGPFGIETYSTLSILAWLHKDALIAAVEAEIDAFADDRYALAPADRLAKADEMNRLLLTAEREEEALIEHAARFGTTLPRRAEADLRAVLGIAAPWEAENEDGETIKPPASEIERAAPRAALVVDATKPDPKKPNRRRPSVPESVEAVDNL